MRSLHFITRSTTLFSAWLAVAELVLTSAPAAAQDYKAIAAAVTQKAIDPFIVNNPVQFQYVQPVDAGVEFPGGINGTAEAGVLGLGTNQFYRARWIP